MPQFPISIALFGRKITHANLQKWQLHERAMRLYTML